MATITKIQMNNTMIEEKDGVIYVDGKSIETGKRPGFDLGMAIFVGFIIGCAFLPLVLVLSEGLARIIKSIL